MKRSSLLAMAVLAATADMQVGAMASPWNNPVPPRKRRPQVQRMVTSSTDEIKAWNAAVDARKAAKKEQQP